MSKSSSGALRRALLRGAPAVKDFPDHVQLVFMQGFAASRVGFVSHLFYEAKREKQPVKAGIALTEKFDKWCLGVQALDVDLRHAGRAIVSKEGSPSIEVYFERRGDSMHPRRIEVSGLTWEGVLDLETADYLTALTATLFSAPPKAAFMRMPGSRPQAGQPPSIDFYRRLEAAYEALLAEGHKQPTAELASRMGVPRNTVKSWLRRGREYLKDEQGDEGDLSGAGDAPPKAAAKPRRDRSAAGTKRKARSRSATKKKATRGRRA